MPRGVSLKHSQRFRRRRLERRLRTDMLSTCVATALLLLSGHGGCSSLGCPNAGGHSADPAKHRNGAEPPPPPPDVLGIHNKLGQEIFISGCFGCMLGSCPHCHHTPVPNGLLTPSPTHSHPCCAPVLTAIALPSPSFSRSQPNRTFLHTKCASSRVGIAPSMHHILAMHRSTPAMHCSVLAMYCSIPAMHHVLAVHRFIPAG